MKRLVPVAALLTLSAISPITAAKVSETDMLGSPARPSAAQRTIAIDASTRSITVERDEVVRFVSNGQEFAWVFKGASPSFSLNKVAPAGVLDRDLVVYVWPNAQDLSDK